jgi:Leucine-rich repeat (LRR) protein
MVEAITLENKLFSLSCNSKTMKNLTSWESLTQHIFRLDLDDVELDLFPFEAMDHVHEIRITNSELSHDALLSIGELKSLRRLNLYGSQLSSSWLLDMVSWTHLEQLILTDSGCDDDMLTILKSELKDTQLIY